MMAASEALEEIVSTTLHQLTPVGTGVVRFAEELRLPLAHHSTQTAFIGGLAVALELDPEAAKRLRKALRKEIPPLSTQELAKRLDELTRVD